ncbi:tol-pal system-associated acyl-CoA thioesterase [Alsobacter metallidurans]|uniref:Tol-pal system-associated acyl-CoA thioesterase n=1 Tax=Alsobacter metallidurans TaxID=340221 RepID=A0A917MJ58_9HYPH|nr:tol-pal system-associated acyl-CoA thioesterase [Alsobacter metallidurans]GGH29858.1 tol-pal system-associated acyl-CoA thioesterase [Alsobacter metallidurans]
MSERLAPHTLSIRVYYEDTDFSGVVYHASYLRFLERGRTEFIRDLGVDQALLHGDHGFGFVVRRMTIDWLKPARMDDIVVVETRPAILKAASMTLNQRVLLGDDVLVTAEVLIASVVHGRPSRLPADIRQRITESARDAGVDVTRKARP